MNTRSKLRLASTLILIMLAFSTYSQDIDSTQIGKEYPYVLPILGKKAYERGYVLQKPFGVMLGSVFNKQGIIISDMQLAFEDMNGNIGEFRSLDGILDFGPSTGRINTINTRVDAWILPFFSVGGYYGKVWGEQSITFRLFGNDKLFESVTAINGQYYGFNMVAVAPLGPVNLAVDYSWSWTTNDRLDKPVLVKVSGARLIYRFMTKTPQRFFAVYAGAQYQNLTSQTSGSIGIDEALGISEEDKQFIDDQWEAFMGGQIPDKDGNYWDDLNLVEKATYSTAYQFIRGLSDTTIYYKFRKKLEYEYNMLLGANYQHNARWQARAEYGFLKSKKQLMVSVNYRFGF
jgi:hypothetical protein